MGTAPNVNCLVEGTFLQMTSPYETPAWACEFGESGFRKAYAPYLPAALGDWRPSQIFRKTLSSSPISKTGKSTSYLGLYDMGPTLDAGSKMLLASTLGLRSAGTHKGVVFLAGPAINQQAINVFAFNARTNQFIGAQPVPGYNNIRKWIVAGGEMYTTVGKVGGGGALVKWAGSLASPFQFVEVGTLPSEGAELVEHAGRIFVATWPTVDPAKPVYSGIFKTNTIPAKGGLPASQSPLTKYWDARDYEPDPIIALSYGGGALASYKGELVWGTMHVPLVATAIHMQVYAKYYNSIINPEEKAAKSFLALLATQRGIAIFSTKNRSTEIQLLYGQAKLPAFDPVNHWKLLSNSSDLTPKMGLSGFNNFFNNYTWTMATNGDSLFVGTMDWSYLLRSRLSGLIDQLMPESEGQFDAWLADATASNPDLGQFLDEHGEFVETLRGQFREMDPVIAENPRDLFAYGADLMRFDSLGSKALAVSRNGLGNYANYGFRTMIADGNKLFIGSANPMNLLTDEDGTTLLGGWELINLNLIK
ncbi:MAG: hypothetical protein RLZZ09_2266 [Pseudomonadota bacterium]